MEILVFFSGSAIFILFAFAFAFVLEIIDVLRHRKDFDFSFAYLPPIARFIVMVILFIGLGNLFIYYVFVDPPVFPKLPVVAIVVSGAALILGSLIIIRLLSQKKQSQSPVNDYERRYNKEKKKNLPLKICLVISVALILILSAGIIYLLKTVPSVDEQREPASSAVTSKVVYYVTPAGTKYHVEGCISIEGKDNLKTYKSAKKAEAAGYEPCKICIK